MRLCVYFYSTFVANRFITFFTHSITPPTTVTAAAAATLFLNVDFSHQTEFIEKTIERVKISFEHFKRMYTQNMRLIVHEQSTSPH